MKKILTQTNLINSRKVLLMPIFLMFLLITSCHTVGYLAGGEMQQFSGTHIIKLTEQHTDILDIIGDVGKSMSLIITQMDASRGFIGLSSRSSAAAMMGSYNGQSISVISTDGGRKLDVTVAVSGNFNAGTKEEGDSLFSDFQKRLFEKVK